MPDLDQLTSGAEESGGLSAGDHGLKKTKGEKLMHIVLYGVINSIVGIPTMISFAAIIFQVPSRLPLSSRPQGSITIFLKAMSGVVPHKSGKDIPALSLQECVNRLPNSRASASHKSHMVTTRFPLLRTCGPLWVLLDKACPACGRVLKRCITECVKNEVLSQPLFVRPFACMCTYRLRVCVRERVFEHESFSSAYTISYGT